MSSDYQQYAESDELSIEQAKLRLAKFLNANANGRDNAVPGTELAEKVPQSYSTVRDMVLELRSERGLAVKGCNDGYYIVHDPDELDRVVGQLNDQIATTERRKRELVQAFNRGRYDD